MLADCVSDRPIFMISACRAGVLASFFGRRLEHARQRIVAFNADKRPNPRLCLCASTYELFEARLVLNSFRDRRARRLA